MEKILKKYTNIPEHLYVERGGDHQLKRIIEDMQRPGYVLVARQMGKTNLLFNAKRTLENKNRLFAYVDLSNLYDNERDCYRNIINNIVEPNDHVFADIEQEVISVQEKLLPPHNEFSRCLRIILEAFKGDLIIILDEIDALKSVEYSDNIFAQIRSTYFSRTNYPVFERLTYVLSGVIEPTELIKDKNKSPFNIGDKIYLDDFSIEEHEVFISKSKIIISDEISREIYNWTSGNPRLTFDICSEIESHIIEFGKINKDDISKIIEKKYLTTFDIAPIDHIRELVRTNKQIRNAVSDINRNRTSELGDVIKSKLYLYGIINSRFNEETFIKNKIIEQSLTEEWIKSIEKLSTDIYTYALEKIDSGDFPEAIDSFLEFLSNSNATRSQVEVSNYNLGFAYYSINDYHNAEVYFSKEYEIDLYKSNSKALLGISRIGIGEYESGIGILEGVIAEKTHDFAYRNALLNLATHIREQDGERAISLFEELYESTFNCIDEVSEEELNKIRTLTLFYQSNAFVGLNEYEKSLKKLDGALKYAKPSDSVFLHYSKHFLEEGKDSELRQAIVTTILNNNIRFDKDAKYPFSFTEALLYHFLEFIFTSEDFSLFEELLNHSLNVLLPKSLKSDIVYQVSRVSEEKRHSILKYLLDTIDEEVKPELLLKVYKDLILIEINRDRFSFETFFKYQVYFKETEVVKNNDIYIHVYAIKHYSDLNKIQEAIHLCDTIADKLERIDDKSLRFESVMIYYWYSTLYFTLRNRKEAIHYAKIALDIVSKTGITSIERTSIIDEKGLKSISDQLNQIILSSNIISPYVKKQDYGRNDRVKVRYSDGSVIERKYKQVEADIIAERCIII